MVNKMNMTIKDGIKFGIGLALGNIIVSFCFNAVFSLIGALLR